MNMIPEDVRPKPSKCPQCGGQGEYQDWGTTNWKGQHPNVHRCYVCAGTGSITDGTWEFYKKTGTWPDEPL